MSFQAKKDERPASLAVVRWHGLGGVLVSSYPLPRPLAEAVARAFAATYPRESFWVEDIPWLTPSAPAVRIAGHRRAATPRVRSAMGDAAPSVAP